MKVKKLKKNDTIGLIIASSCNRQQERMPKIETIIKSLGYNYKYGKTVFLKDGYLAGTDEERVKDIHDFFIDDNINAILCFKGGFGASRIVDKIDYKLIKEHPKLFIGLSDVTALLNNFYKYSNLPTIHGEVGILLGSKNIDQESLNDFKDLLTLNTKGRVLTGNNIKTLVGGVVTGKIVGGNLSLISDLHGTPYEIDFDSKIVLIEEVEEEPYNIDRMFAQLRLSKNIYKAKGFIFGYFTDCKDPLNEQSYEALIKEYFGSLNVPIIYDFPTGHEFPLLNVPIGLEVKLDADNKTITIMEELYEKD
ncbi:MAG: LD-carboxypeptidase [Bacilli bacterium]|nr:LD-carboxypeptidase [Acholeplasmataceae bacterium]MDY2903241.1 LD-carboxypeptidase [Bacilli bacterium]